MQAQQSKPAKPTVGQIMAAKRAKKRARDWWRQRHAEEPPTTTYQALQRVSELRTPRRVRVWVNKKYPEVLSAEW